MADFNVSIVFAIPLGDQDKLVLGISSLRKFVLDIGYTIKSKGCVKYLYYKVKPRSFCVWIVNLTL